jgi:hypothetical protein
MGSVIVPLYIMQIVRILLKFRLPFSGFTIDINAKNSEGFTAFDMLQGDNKQMKKILRNARWLNIKHCSRLTSHANYFKSPVSIDERLYIFFLRLTTSISNEIRNVSLVVAVLLVTVSFQTAVSPPGGVWQDNYIPLTNNTSPDNARDEYLQQYPHYAGTAVMGNSFFFPVLLSLNTLSFFFTLYIIFLLLPSDFRMVFGIPLYTLSLYFIASLCITSPNNVPAGLLWIWNNIFIYFCVCSFLLIKIFEVIVFYRGHKLTEAFLPRK